MRAFAFIGGVARCSGPLLFCLVLTFSLITVGSLPAQDANYTVKTDGQADVPAGGGLVDITFLISDPAGDDIQGFQWGVCTPMNANALNQH